MMVSCLWCLQFSKLDVPKMLVITPDLCLPGGAGTLFMEGLPSIIFYKQESWPHTQSPKKHYLSRCLGHTLTWAPLSSI